MKAQNRRRDSWLVRAAVGDRFRWRHDGTICRIIAVKDNGVQLNFIYETGPQKGRWGYTLQPQDVELYGVLDQLADINPT